ncbi:polyketide cyclase/dehydrase/lipid transport protein [Maribacter caenipelagi]|uniref:Polyketide cyclase/dehydrase/lipid transport protein n=1 Tax=Maribacter caenipelagi TaxID=1447781 RepID=A0A4R7D2W9_9FLAO|nr:SRPBCC family protein [Maribacter caenipelagi]TDS15353.1 polyketide cyclase/dehydrase/lipid transport protein [Maribacter caenipelagi]
MYTVFIIITIVVTLVIILALIAPKGYEVSRSIELDHSPEKVWQHLKFLKKQQEWSPWARKDLNMDLTFTGVDGEIGATSHWSGNKDVGEGEQEITRIVEGERIEQDLRFLKPYKSQSDCYMTLEEYEVNKSKVTWGFTGKNKFPMSIMMLFMSMDKMVGKDFEQGLQNLKHNLNN